MRLGRLVLAMTAGLTMFACASGPKKGTIPYAAKALGVKPDAVYKVGSYKTSLEAMKPIRATAAILSGDASVSMDDGSCVSSGMAGPGQTHYLLEAARLSDLDGDDVITYSEAEKVWQDQCLKRYKSFAR